MTPWNVARLVMWQREASEAKKTFDANAFCNISMELWVPFKMEQRTNAGMQKEIPPNMIWNIETLHFKVLQIWGKVERQVSGPSLDKTKIGLNSSVAPGTHKFFRKLPLINLCFFILALTNLGGSYFTSYKPLSSYLYNGNSNNTALEGYTLD